MEEKKKGKGKIILFIILVIVVIGALVGIYLWDKDNTSKLEKAITDPALDYFDKYMSANTGAAAYKVTIEMLEEANNNGENYNLKKLDKCDKKTTYATINIDYFNGKVTGTTVKLDCKKF